jgi:hypothetical protein
LPRRSPYTIVLTADERAALEAQARRYTLPYRDVVRAKIALLAADGLGNDQIADRLDTRLGMTTPFGPGVMAGIGPTPVDGIMTSWRLPSWCD